MSVVAYWRNDKKDNLVHFYTECPEIQEAKSIGRGTIQEARRNGHVIACQKCKDIKCKKEFQEKTQKEYEKFVKERNEKSERLKIGIYCFMTTIFVFMFCFFTMFVPQSGNENEAYNAGYQDGKTESSNDYYNKGYDEGYSDGYSAAKTSYKNAYNDGYNQALRENGIASSSVQDLTNYDPVVFVTSTGDKYHRALCEYLRYSSYELTLSEAKAKGYEPCEVCNPPQ